VLLFTGGKYKEEEEEEEDVWHATVIGSLNNLLYL
jgi:hypothetical protein